MGRFPGRTLTGLVALAVVAALTACGSSSATSSAAAAAPRRLPVVAVEDFWGSIAKQLGGDYVEVESLIANPDTDPHDYEPTPRDARALASAKLVITNGIGYDGWADKLLAANRMSGR